MCSWNPPPPLFLPSLMQGAALASRSVDSRGCDAKGDLNSLMVVAASWGVLCLYVMAPGCYHTLNVNSASVSVEHLSLNTKLTMRTEKVDKVLGCNSVVRR